jgi:hypothetical protein
MALAQSIGSRNDTKPKPRALFSPFVRITFRKEGHVPVNTNTI